MTPNCIEARLWRSKIVMCLHLGHRIGSNVFKYVLAQGYLRVEGKYSGR